MEHTVENLAGSGAPAESGGWSLMKMLPARLQSGPVLLLVSLAGFWIVYALALVLGRTLGRGSRRHRET